MVSELEIGQPSGGDGAPPPPPSASQAPPASYAPMSTLTTLPHLVTVKLTHENYLLWCAQLQPYLQGQCLFGYINGSKAQPPSFLSDNVTPNPKFISWHQQDQLILSAIISSLSEPLIIQVIGHPTSRST